MGLRRKTIGSAKLPLSDKELKSKLKELRRLEKWAFRPRHGRTDFYEYLEGVYDLCDWTDSKVSRRIGQRVAKLRNLKVRAGTKPIRIVIDAISPGQSRREQQEKSEWTQALQYAITKKAGGSGFKKFLDRNGGPSGCAKKMAALRKQKRARVWARTWGRKKGSSPTK
jgi:hypothetical protein